MKSSYYDLFRNTRTYRYVVLAKGFKAFRTDSYAEAVNDADIKAMTSDRVSILDDGHLCAMWSYGTRVQVIR